jgi:hypothetical protein
MIKTPLAPAVAPCGAMADRPKSTQGERTRDTFSPLNKLILDETALLNKLLTNF